MASWQRKKISQGQTIGDRLRKTRLEKELSLTDVHQQTKIQVKYLELLENGNYQSLPGEIYIRTWIKLYAGFLDLPSHELLADYKLEKVVSAKVRQPEKSNNHHANTRLSLKQRLGKILGPHFLKRAVIVLIVLIFLSYLAWEVNNTISPPTITIVEPVDNFKTTDNNIDIKGQTEPEVQLTINNELILLDEQGNFIKNINLSTGLNNLEISAKKKHSRAQVIEIVVLRESAE
ncbi:helix-turn-helix domain-containing protein [bacterium]|jgi:cytoskeletal protein RodZ|nr:helix-turn-helix domain-containing protein [bacterium]